MSITFSGVDVSVVPGSVLRDAITAVLVSNPAPTPISLHLLYEDSEPETSIESLRKIYDVQWLQELVEEHYFIVDVALGKSIPEALFRDTDWSSHYESLKDVLTCRRESLCTGGY